MGYAADLVRHGQSNALLAGGVDEFSFESFVGFDRAGLLCTNHTAPECPIPFERRRNGFALGEGAGFLVLEDLEGARARDAIVLAEIKGCASTFDHSQGRDSSLAVQAVVRSMRLAMARSGMTAADVDFVSASANGGVLSDCFELSALSLVFEDLANDLPVTAIKCGIGEGLGASGPAQIAAAIETFRQGKLPGISGLEELPPGCPLGGIRSTTVETQAHNALINAVGLGGHCFSLVLSSFDN